MAGGVPQGWGTGGVFEDAATQHDTDFQKISPANQQILLRYFSQASQDPGHAKEFFAQAMQADPSLASAMQEAGQVGALDHGTWVDKVVLAGAIAAMGGIGLSALGGGAAAPTGGGSTAGLGPVAAGGGTTAATVPPALASSGGVLPALAKYGGIAGDVGRVASGVAGGLANGRREDAATNGRAIAENNQAKTQAAEFNLKLPEARTNQVARGEVLNTMQNAPLTGDARIDKFSGGGLRPSAFGPESRQAGAELSRQALGHLMDPAGDRLTPQEIPGTSASTPENIAAGIGIGGDIFSLLAKYGGR